MLTRCSFDPGKLFKSFGRRNVPEETDVLAAPCPPFRLWLCSLYSLLGGDIFGREGDSKSQAAALWRLLKPPLGFSASLSLHWCLCSVAWRKFRRTNESLTEDCLVFPAQIRKRQKSKANSWWKGEIIVPHLLRRLRSTRLSTHCRLHVWRPPPPPSWNRSEIFLRIMHELMVGDRQQRSLLPSRSKLVWLDPEKAEPQVGRWEDSL